MKPIHLLALATVALACVPVVSAKNAFRLQMISQYKMPANSKITTCQFCHQSPNGGRNFNGFGQNVLQQFDAAGDNIQVALFEVLKLNKDSDGDGYPDVLEVLAKTAPGDAKSKPTQTVAALQAQLKKTGGVEQFKK